MGERARKTWDAMILKEEDFQLVMAYSGSIRVERKEELG
jgi:hypothetical protein